jgi:hypothetical protein
VQGKIRVQLPESLTGPFNGKATLIYKGLYNHGGTTNLVFQLEDSSKSVKATNYRSETSNTGVSNSGVSNSGVSNSGVSNSGAVLKATGGRPLLFWRQEIDFVIHEISALNDNIKGRYISRNPADQGIFEITKSAYDIDEMEDEEYDNSICTVM